MFSLLTAKFLDLGLWLAVFIIYSYVGASSETMFKYKKLHIPELGNDSYRGISARDGVVILGGEDGKVVMLQGDQVQVFKLDGGDGLEIRDIAAMDLENTVLMGSGYPAKIFRRKGTSFSEVYHNNNTGAFLNSIAFWNEQKGIGFGDAIQGKLLVIVTEDGGYSWREIGNQEDEAAPEVDESEHGFAASGTSLIVGEPGEAWIALGGGKEGGAARVLKTEDYGRSWTSYSTSLDADSPSKGIFSLALYKNQRLIAVGGDYEDPSLSNAGGVGFSIDGGKTWQSSTSPTLGYRSCVAVKEDLVLATGPTGIDLSKDQGTTWLPLIKSMKNDSFNSLAVDTDGTVWIAGKNGLLAKMIIDM